MSLAGKTILITGGTGSLGKAFTRHALCYGAAKVKVYSRDEFKQSIMQQEIHDARMRYLIGDVRDVDRLRWALDGVDIVVHAAAMKQVPACEYNPEEAVKTNIDGAKCLIDATRGSTVQRVVCISSDKAVSPVNLYGATKAVAEKLFLAANAMRPIFSCTRWGNIQNSRGSVIPFFKDKEVLPVTAMEMTRFLVTLSEVMPVIEAAIEAPPGMIWIRKSLSFRMAELAYAFGRPWDLVGLRQGEKMHETLVSEYEVSRAFDLGDMIYIRPQTFFDTDLDYNLGGVQLDRPYSSDSNGFLSVEDLKVRIENVD